MLSHFEKRLTFDSKRTASLRADESTNIQEITNVLGGCSLMINTDAQKENISLCSTSSKRAGHQMLDGLISFNRATHEKLDGSSSSKRDSHVTLYGSTSSKRAIPEAPDGSTSSKRDSHVTPYGSTSSKRATHETPEGSNNPKRDTHETSDGSNNPKRAIHETPDGSASSTRVAPETLDDSISSKRAAHETQDGKDDEDGALQHPFMGAIDAREDDLLKEMEVHSIGKSTQTDVTNGINIDELVKKICSGENFIYD